MKMILPTVSPIFLLRINDAISVPSRTDPLLTANPIPAPRRAPPKTAESILSSVIMGNLKMTRDRERRLIVKTLLIIETLFKVLNPIAIKGRLIMIIKTDRGIFVTSERSIDIPVTPPSRNPLGIRKLSSPIAAQKTASAMPNASEKIL
jgi:hypothetical protein